MKLTKLPLILFLLTGCASLPHLPKRAPASQELGDSALASIANDIRDLVEFQNRDACNVSDRPGIVMAEQWLADQFKKIPNLIVKTEEFEMKGCDLPLKRKNVVAQIEGTDRKDEVILFGGHYDSIALSTSQGWVQEHRQDYAVTSIAPGSKAPGANDSGSQTAALLQIAREISSLRLRRTIVFVGFAGEEQGLIGSKAFVQKLKSILPGKKVIAMINLDIVGGDKTANDEQDLKKFRLFSPNQKPHIELAQKVLELNEKYFPEFKGHLVQAVDRPHRSGDQVSFQKGGIPAVRIVETKENLFHQHSIEDVEKYLSYDYIHRIARLCSIVARSLAE